MSLDDEETVEALCDEIASGKGVNQAAPIIGVHESTVYRRMAKDPEFARLIASAREAQQEFVADEVVQMADEADESNYNVVKLRIWARQWRAAKLAPKKYGDKTLVETNAVVKVEHTRKLDISTLSDLELDALENALRATVAQLGAPGKVIEHEE